MTWFIQYEVEKYKVVKDKVTRIMTFHTVQFIKRNDF